MLQYGPSIKPFIKLFDSATRSNFPAHLYYSRFFPILPTSRSPTAPTTRQIIFAANKNQNEIRYPTMYPPGSNPSAGQRYYR